MQRDVDVVVGEQLELVLFRSEVQLSTPAIVHTNLGITTFRVNHQPVDLVVLNRLNEFNVAETENSSSWKWNIDRIKASN